MPLHTQFPYPLYLVLSPEHCTRLHWLDIAEEAIKGGVDVIQYRDKLSDDSDFFYRAKKLKNITDYHKVPLIINDRVEAAIQLDAFGIHVGVNDMLPSVIRKKFSSKLHIGWSVEDISQLGSKEIAFTDSIALSPIFSTSTKTDTVTEWGIQGIIKIRRQTEKPIIAIGNMNDSNAGRMYDSGANSIAVVSAICDSKNPRQAAAFLKNSLL